MSAPQGEKAYHWLKEKMGRNAAEDFLTEAFLAGFKLVDILPEDMEPAE